LDKQSLDQSEIKVSTAFPRRKFAWIQRI